MKYGTVMLLGLMLLLLGACGETGPQSGGGATPTPATVLPEVLLEYSRQGGIAGFCDNLEVRQVEALVSHCGDEVTTIPIAPEMQEELAQLARQYAPFETRSEDNPGGVDSMVQQVRFNGVGEQEAGAAVQASLYQLALELMAREPGQ